MDVTFKGLLSCPKLTTRYTSELTTLLATTGSVGFVLLFGHLCFSCSTRPQNGVIVGRLKSGFVVSPMVILLCLLVRTIHNLVYRPPGVDRRLLWYYSSLFSRELIHVRSDSEFDVLSSTQKRNLHLL